MVKKTIKRQNGFTDTGYKNSTNKKSFSGKLMKIKEYFSALSWKRKIIFLTIFIGIVLLGRYLYVKASGGKITYETAKVEKGTIVSTVSASGNVISANTFTVKTSASGVVAKVYVKDGDSVTKGQKIAEIELDLDGEQQYAQAYANYVSAVNQLESAKNTLRSATASLNNVYDQIQGHHTNETFAMIEIRTKAEVARDNAQNSLKSAQANLTNADFNLKANSPVIIAPNSGTILGLTIAEGLPLSAQTTTTGSRTGQRIASIVKGGSPLVSVNLSEIDVPKIKVGQKATITFDSISNRTFTGVVSAIDRSGTTVSNVTSYPAIIKLDSGSEQILPNMAVTANIITAIKSDVLVIPISAIQTQNGQTTVNVLKNGITQSVTIETGLSSDSQIEVISGLSEGNEVVTATSNSSNSQGSTRSVFSRGGFGGGAFIGR